MVRSLTRMLLLACVLTTPLLAGNNRWTVGGPPPAECEPHLVNRCTEVTSIALDPFDDNIQYVTMMSGKADTPLPIGLWRTSDGGATWTRLITPHTNSSDELVKVEVSRTNPSTLYLLTEGGLYRSADGGETWSGSTLPDDFRDSTDLAVDPRNDNLLYVSKENFCLFGGCNGGGVFRSDDGGRHWREAGLDKQRTERLAVDPRDSSALYAITDGRLFQTTNRGGSWKNITPPGASVSSVVVDPLVSNTLYATNGTFSNWGTGVFKSIDRGRTWTLLQSENFADGWAQIITSDLTGTQFLTTAGFGRLLRSVDNGATWSRLSTGQESGAVQIVVGKSGTDFHGVFEDGLVMHYSISYPRRRSAGK